MNNNLLGYFTGKNKPKKTATTIQMEGAECGAASLSTILKYYGRYVPLDELRVACCVSRDGANAQFIIEAAKEYGLETKSLRVNKFYLNNLASYPAIAYWGFNHFLVIEGIDQKHAYLSDPAQGRYRVTLDYFYKKFAGILIELKPNDKFSKGGRKEVNLEKIIDIVDPYKRLIGLYLLVVLANAIPVLFIAGGVALFTDEIMMDGRFDLSVGTFWMILVAALLSVLLLSISKVIDRRITYLMTKEMAAQAFQKLQTVPLAFLETRFEGELAQRTILAIRVPQLIASSIITFFADFVVALGVLAISFFISSTIGLVFLLAFIVNIALVIGMTRGRLDVNVSYAIAAAESNAITLEGISNIEVLKSCGLEFDFLERWIKKYILQVNQSQELLRDVAKTSVVSTASQFLVTACIYIIGGFLILYTNQVTIGSLLSLQFLIGVISGPFVRIPRILYAFQNLDGQIGRFLDLMKNEDDKYVNPYLTFLERENKRAVLSDSYKSSVASSSETASIKSLELRNISHRFTNKSPYLFKDLNVDLSNFDHYTFVGKSGCGKSTLLKFLAGLAVPAEGVFLIDGLPWDRSRTSMIRKNIGYVPQKPSLFNGTLRENLVLFNTSSICDEEIYETSKITGVDRIIYEHSDRLDYEIFDGGKNLSGGQRQLIEITRVLLRKPKILLLDEATSALDSETERQVLNAIWELKFRTISAAHRLLSARMSDCIGFIEDGKIVESGNPNNLLHDASSHFSQLAAMEES